MLAKVKMVYEVELFVKGDSREQIEEFLMENTPESAVEMAHGKYVAENYEEEILVEFTDDSSFDIDLTKK